MTTATRQLGVVEIARLIAGDVAGPAAAAVDSQNRFPAEAVGALREAGLFGLLVPRGMGGSGATVAAACDIAATLGAGCLSTALVWAMHSQQVAIMADHAADQWQEALRDVALNGALVASATTEPGKGSALLLADAPLVETDGRFVIDRPSPFVSYGDEASYYLVTMRGGPDQPQTDVKYVLLPRAAATVTGDWDAMGMRGTRSVPMQFKGEVEADKILAGDFRGIAVRTAIPVAHLAWTSAWYGAARGALDRFVSSLREGSGSSRRRLGSEVFRVKLAEVRLSLDLLESMLDRLVDRYEGMRAAGSPRAAYEDPDWTIALNGLKVAGSRLTFAAADALVGIAGLERGYTRTESIGLERTFRDLRSAALMVNNDDLLQLNAQQLFMNT